MLAGARILEKQACHGERKGANNLRPCIIRKMAAKKAVRGTTTQTAVAVACSTDEREDQKIRA